MSSEPDTPLQAEACTANVCSAGFSLHRPWLWLALAEIAGALIFVWLCHLFLARVGDWPVSGAALYRPTPDAAEQAWLARAFAQGRSTLMPLGNELHPSRFSPVGPFLASLGLRLQGRFDALALFEWSRAAIVIGAALLWLWLAAAGVSVVARVVALAAILSLPALREVAGNILQEPALFLLFALALATWTLGLRRLRGRPWDALGLAALTVSGAAMGGMIAIRPTNALLGLAAAADAVVVLGRRRALAAGGALALGAAIVIALDVLQMHATSGLWELAGYHHWIPGFIGFAWEQAVIPPLDDFTDPHWLLTVQSVAGVRDDVTTAGLTSAVTLLVGVLWLAPRAIRCPSRAQSLLLFAFALSQAVLFTFYPHHLPRFFILAYPAFIAAGVAGWDAALRALARLGRVHALLAALAGLTVALLVTGLAWPPPEQISGRHERARTATAELREILAHRANGEAVRELSCPLFVDRLPILNARLLLGLDDWPHPIVPLAAHLDLFWDGHIPQFLMYDVQPPRGRIEDAALWPGDPLQSHLVDHLGQVLDDGRIERLIAHHGRIALYFPPWHEPEIVSLVDWALGHGFTLTDIARNTAWRLVVMQPASSEIAPGPS